MAGTSPDDVGGRPDNTPTETSFDRDALASKLEAQMSQMNSDEHIEDEVIDDESEDAVEEDGTEEENDSSPDQEDEESEDSDDASEEDDDDSEDEEVVEEAADKPAKKGGKTPTLPDSFRRSLAAYGWTEDEIDTNLDALGGKFVEMAASIHSKRNAEVATWAEAGRRSREAEEQQLQAQQGPVVGGVPQPLTPIDLNELKQEYGEDKLIDKIVTPVNATIAALNAVLPQVQAGVAAIQQTHQDAAASQIHAFFDSSKMEPYRKFYGGSDQERSPKQMENRRKVLDEAVLIFEGAKSMHRDVSLDQALQIAHDHTASEFREQAVRKNIRKVAKKRNRGISLSPSKRKSSANKRSGKVTDRASLERKVRDQMRNVFK